MSHATASHLSYQSNLESASLNIVPLYETSEWKEWVCTRDVVDAFTVSCDYWLENGFNYPFLKAQEGEWDRLSRLFLDEKPQGLAFKEFLENNFYPICVMPSSESIVFTGYFEPIYKASPIKTEDFNVPIYKRPQELVLIEDLGTLNPKLSGYRLGGYVEEGTLKPYPSRAEIYKGALEGRGLEIAWLRDHREAYFLSIQGSGVLLWPDHTQTRITYDGTNGRPYQSIGAWLVDQGYIAAQDISMQSIWSWLDQRPEKTLTLFSQNPSYIFFKILGTTSSAPEGALQQPLVPLKSMAVDPLYYPLGIPLWILGKSLDHRPVDACSGLMFAHDTGGAIKGPYRADIFCGTGSEAGERAGWMKLQGSITAFVPKLGFSALHKLKARP